MMGEGEESVKLVSREEVSIRLENINKVFALGIIGKTKIAALQDINLEIRRGEILGILGESGSGKSTLAKVVLGFEKPTSGRVLFGGVDVWRLKRGEMKEYYKRVQGVFQDPYASFNPRRTVFSVLRDTLRNYLPEYGRDDAKAREYIGQVLRSVGSTIDMVEGKYPHQFSGGQLQRIAIARALLTKPDFIVADEPVSMLDASLRIDVLNVFIDLKEKLGVTPVIIGHDYSLAYYVSDRIVVLYRGQIVEEGPVDILGEPSHPYTKMLKEAVPLIDRKWEKKSGLDEKPSTPPPSGCVYAGRCPFKMAICEKQEPPLVNLGDSRVKCWLYTSK